MLTCTIVLIRAWFTSTERARANTVFLLSLAIAPMIANPISGFVLSVSTWRTMFLLEAAARPAMGRRVAGGRSPTARRRRRGCRKRNATG